MNPSLVAKATIYSPKRHGAAALHDLAEGVACNWSRKRRGVRQPHAAFSEKRCCGRKLKSPHVVSYNDPARTS